MRRMEELEVEEERKSEGKSLELLKIMKRVNCR